METNIATNESTSFYSNYVLACLEKKYSYIKPSDRKKILEKIGVQIETNNPSFDTIIQIIKKLNEEILKKLAQNIKNYIHNSSLPSDITKEFSVEKILADFETIKYIDGGNNAIIKVVEQKVKPILKNWLTLTNPLDPSFYKDSSEFEIKKTILDFFIFARAIYKKYGFVLFPRLREILLKFKENLSTRNPKIIGLFGKTGMGKTETTIFLSKFFFKKEPIIFSPSKQTSKKEIESIFAKGMKEGRPVILDEVNLADQNIFISLNPIFDAFSMGRKVIINGEEIKPKKGFFIFFTGNTYSYKRFELDESTKNRILYFDIDSMFIKPNIISNFITHLTHHTRNFPYVTSENINRSIQKIFDEDTTIDRIDNFIIARLIATVGNFGFNYQNMLIGISPYHILTPRDFGKIIVNFRQETMEKINLKDLEILNIRLIIKILSLLIGTKRNKEELFNFLKNLNLGNIITPENSSTIFKIVTGFSPDLGEEIYDTLKEYDKYINILKILDLEEWEKFVQKLIKKEIFDLLNKIYTLLLNTHQVNKQGIKWIHEYYMLISEFINKHFLKDFLKLGDNLKKIRKIDGLLKRIIFSIDYALNTGLLTKDKLNEILKNIKQIRKLLSTEPNSETFEEIRRNLIEIRNFLKKNKILFSLSELQKKDKKYCRKTTYINLPEHLKKFDIDEISCKHFELYNANYWDKAIYIFTFIKLLPRIVEYTNIPVLEIKVNTIVQLLIFAKEFSHKEELLKIIHFSNTITLRDYYDEFNLKDLEHLIKKIKFPLKFKYEITSDKYIKNILEFFLFAIQNYPKIKIEEITYIFEKEIGIPHFTQELLKTHYKEFIQLLEKILEKSEKRNKNTEIIRRQFIQYLEKYIKKISLDKREIPEKDWEYLMSLLEKI